MFHCKALWLLLLFTGLFAVAWKSNEPPRPAPAQQKKTATPAAATTAAPADEVAAIVNGDKIMLSELVGRLEELGVKPEKREDVAGDVLDAMIDNSLMIQFLTGQKIAFDPKVVDKQIAELKAEYEKEGAKFSEALTRIGLTEQKLRASVIAEVQWDNYLKKTVSEKQLADYFAKYREYFDGTQVRASHILVEVAPDADDEARSAAQGKIERIRKELSSGLDFSQAAKKYSDCPSKEQGGDVDFFGRSDKMVEPFAKAAFLLKVGEVSGVVETEFGYHIIKVTDRKAGTRTKLDDPALHEQLLDSYGEKLKNEIVANQRKVAKIEIAPGAQPQDQPKAKTATQQSGSVKK
jgi:parvulin-like peptidyl-prolyl isomerase